nr:MULTISPECIES: hypothetical protein [unclassified Lysinibacillus]
MIKSFIEEEYSRPGAEENLKVGDVNQAWKNHKITAVEAIQKVGMKSNTFYRRVKEYEYYLQESNLS